MSRAADDKPKLDQLSAADREWLALEGDDDAALLSEQAELELAEALRAAYQPVDLPDRLNQALIELALEDPFAEASEEEQAESERLREALDLGVDHPLADLARSVQVAADPGRIDTARNDQLIAAALRDAQISQRPSGGKLIRVSFGTIGAVLAAAAGVLIWFQTLGQAPSDTSSASVEAQQLSQPLAISRSTGPLFHEKFDTKQTSARVDRIASARSRELRNNRYASWGAR